MSTTTTSGQASTEPWTGTVDIDTVIPNPDQPRKYFDDDEMDRTSQSVDQRQIQAVLVIPHTDPARPKVRWMIVDGERRWRGLKLRQKTRIKIIHDPEITRENLFSSSFAANFCRAGHTHAETAAAIDREIEAGRTYEEIGAMVGKTKAWAYQEHCLLKLHPRLLALMDPPTPKEKKLPSRIALLLIQVPRDEQLHHYERAKKLKADEAFHKLRTSRTFVDAAPRIGKGRDKEYLIGKLNAILRNLDVFFNTPRAMLKSLTPEALNALDQELDRIAKLHGKCLERLANARQGIGEAYD